jgi:hypothetical protein
MRAALVHTVDGETVVDNVIVIDGDYQPPEGFTLHELDDTAPVGPGFTLLDGTWHPPAAPAQPPVPTIAELLEQIAAMQQQIQLLQQTSPPAAQEENDGTVAP